MFFALPVAIKRLRELIQHSGSDSPAYVAADLEVSQLLARIMELANVPINAPGVRDAAFIEVPWENVWAT